MIFLNYLMTAKVSKILQTTFTNSEIHQTISCLSVPVEQLGYFLCSDFNLLIGMTIGSGGIAGYQEKTIKF